MGGSLFGEGALYYEPQRKSLRKGATGSSGPMFNLTKTVHFWLLRIMNYLLKGASPLGSSKEGVKP